MIKVYSKSINGKKVLLSLLIALASSSTLAANGVAGGTGNNVVQGISQGTNATPNSGVGGSGFILKVDGATSITDNVIESTTQYVGGDSLGNNKAGIGLEILDGMGGGAFLTELTNDGVLQGGNGDVTSITSLGGNGVFLKSIHVGTFTNNNLIAAGNGPQGTNGLYIYQGVTIDEMINNGTIRGGNNITNSTSGRGGTGVSIEYDSSVKLTNNSGGLIQGGSGMASNRAGHGIYVIDGQLTLNNMGIIKGGDSDLGTAGSGIYMAKSSAYPNGNLHLINSGVVSGGVDGTGQRGKAVYLETVSNIIELQSGGSFVGNLHAVSGNQTFIVNATKDSSQNIFDLSQITGSGWNSSYFQKKGSYDWTLTGTTASNIRTNWSIEQGNLIVGAAGDNTTINGTVVVNNGGMLSGFGTINKMVTISNGGIISPGNHSTGTMTVGDIDFQSGSIYEVNANINGSSDQIKVTANNTSGSGTATIQGGTVKVLAGNGNWGANYDYTILVADNLSATDRFDQVTTNLAFLTPTLDYNTVNEVHLLLTRNSKGFADIAISRNQKQTANGLESLSNNSQLKNAILSLSTLDAITAYDNLSGEIHASVQAALLNDRYLRDAINEHLINRFETQDTGLWVTSWGATENLGSDNNAAKTSNNVFGIMVGADNNLNASTKVGLALSYQHNNINLNKGRHADADIDSYHIAAYLGTAFAYDINLRTGLDYAYLNIRTDRKVQVGGVKEKNKDSYHGNLVQGFVEISKGIKVSEQLKLEPYLNVAHIYMDARFNEGSNITALKGSGENQATFSTAGLRTKVDMTEKTKLVIGAGWQHAYGNRKADTDMKFNGGSSFNVNGVPLNKDATIAQLGLEVSLTPNTNISANYQGQFGNRVENNAVKVGLTYKF